MHASELVELAAAVSTQGPALIHGKVRPSAAAIEQYWHGSKCRLDCWSRALRRYAKNAPGAGREWRSAHWPMMRAVFEEVLAGEILTRVFAAVMCGYDRHHGSDVAEPVARSIFIGHLEARHRVLTIMLRGPGINAQQAAMLNQLRRKTERWSDMLLGYLMTHVEIDDFAVDPGRAKEFAEDLSHQKELKNGSSAWALVKASMKTAFGRGLGPLAANGDLNEKIALGVLACFASDQFDSIGKLRSLWMARLHGAADDAQGLIDELAAEEQYDATEEARLASEDHLQRLRKFGCC